MTKFCNEKTHALLAILLVVIGLLSVATFRAFGVADEARRSQASYQQLTCERGNVLRAYLIIDVGRSQKDPAARQQSALDLFPLVGCEGEGTDPMTYDEREEYITKIARRLGRDNWRAR